MKNADILTIGKSTIEKEAYALSELGRSLNKVYVAVVDKLLKCQGRVILTGIGKSSHVAKKIASTFASTGTAAFFIHPAEASHGDLGMIKPGDLLIALSRSGESTELQDILHYCKKISVIVVGVTSNKKSTLFELSDLKLLLPNIDEACTLGLAPTTSSIMMMALGDALAVACLELKNFTKNDFKGFHPAGKLGLNLLKVSDIMHTGEKIPLLSIDASVSDSILEMTRCRFGCVGITDYSGSIIGIFTDGDLRRNLAFVNLSDSISDLMVKNPVLLSPDIYVIEAVETFKNKRIPSVFVCEKKKPIGILHIHDLLQKGFL